MTRGRYVSGEDINRVNRLAREQTARIEALAAAARAVVDEMTGRTVPKGTHLWCNWCDSTPIGSTDPRCEERDYATHYAECPVGVLAALVLPVEVGTAAAMGLNVARLALEGEQT